MKTTTTAIVALALVVMPSYAPTFGLSSIAAAVQWYSGGTLHRATANQWLRGSYSNKLATAADWVVTGMGKSQVRRITGGNIDRLRPYATQLVACVDETAPVSGNSRASELAAACTILLGY